MTINNNILKILLISFLIFFLAGCQSMSEGIEFEANLPEDTEIHFLIRCAKPENPPDMQTEIAAYQEDGFVCADIYLPNAGVYYGNFLFDEDNSPTRVLRQYVQQYPEIRIAVTDMDGSILKVSPVFSLRIPDRNYFWKKIDYDFDTNQITGLETLTLDESHFVNMLKWTLISWISMHVLIGGTSISRKLFPILWIICSIPIFRMLSLQYEQFFTPYYQSDNWTLKDSLWWMGICDLPWLLVSITGWIKLLLKHRITP